MKIHELFEREIGRTINPAVVVSNQKEETIDAEIAEYVFTDELIEKLYLILDTIVNKRSGKTGIWINGYYGSGKSHFIKILSYLLENIEASNPATGEKRRAAQFFDHAEGVPCGCFAFFAVCAQLTD